MDKKEFTVTIKRGLVDNFKWVKYKVPAEEGMTVLGVLDYIYRNIDSSLAYYQSCRHGRCKGCWVEINGKPALSCEVIASDNMKLAPLKKFEIIRDLIVDFKKLVKVNK